jgi:hypothetical protein
MKLKTLFTLTFIALFFITTSHESFAQKKSRKKSYEENTQSTSEQHSQQPAQRSRGLNTSGTYGTAGCGLGSMVFGNQEGMIQVVAATLNGTSGSQTFGITSGTSNCDPNSKSSASLQNYIRANTLALEKDISRGSGPSIEALAQILGCQSSSKLGSTLQKNFSMVFDGGSAEKTASEIQNLVKGSPELQSDCKVRS